MPLPVDVPFDKDSATSSSSSSYKFAPVSTKAGSNKATKSKASGSKGLRSVVDAFEQGV